MEQPLDVRECAEADVAVLDRHIPIGRNDAHATFCRRQRVGEVSYLVAWRGQEPVGGSRARTPASTRPASSTG